MSVGYGAPVGGVLFSLEVPPPPTNSQPPPPPGTKLLLPALHHLAVAVHVDCRCGCAAVAELPPQREARAVPGQLPQAVDVVRAPHVHRPRRYRRCGRLLLLSRGGGGAGCICFEFFFFFFFCGFDVEPGDWTMARTTSNVTGLLGTVFIRLNVAMVNFRKRSALKNYPVLEVFCLSIFTSLIGYQIIYLRYLTTNRTATLIFSRVLRAILTLF
jgi:hypothetical protein